MSKKLTYEQLEEKVAELKKENKLIEAKIASLISRHKSKAIERKTDLRIAQLSKALDKLSTYVFIKDLEGRYLYANKQTLKLFNLSEEAVFGKVDSQFQNAEIAERITEIDKRVILYGEDTEREISFFLPDGSERIYRELKT